MRLTNQINVIAWASQFWLDPSIARLWISLVVFGSKLLNELTVHITLASNKEDQMEEKSMCGSDWPNFTNDRRFLSHLLNECASSQFKPGKSWFVPILLFIIHLAMTSECKYTALVSPLVIVLQFVFILCSKLRWFPTSKWVEFVSKSWWIDLLTVRQQ